MTLSTARDRSVAWHDVECAAYTADLRLWEALAQAGDRILELGCGTGRVGLHLAQAGHRVAGVDVDESLVAEFNRRAGALPAVAQTGDAADLALGEAFGLVLAPMQLIQLLPAAPRRVDCLRSVASHLLPGGRVALAIVEGLPSPGNAAPALGGRVAPPHPDTLELDGWVYSSLPLETVIAGDAIVVRRLRQSVSPGGELSEEVNEVELRTLTAEELEREAALAGLRAVGRHEIPPTDAHVGSTIVLLGGER